MDEQQVIIEFLRVASKHIDEALVPFDPVVGRLVFAWLRSFVISYCRDKEPQRD